MVKTQPSSTKALFSFLWGFRSFVKYEVFLKWRSRTSKKGGVMLLLLLSALVLLSGCAEIGSLFKTDERVKCVELTYQLKRLLSLSAPEPSVPTPFQICAEKYREGSIDQKIRSLEDKIDFFSSLNLSERYPHNYCKSDSDCIAALFPYAVDAGPFCVNHYYFYEGSVNDSKCRCIYSQCQAIDQFKITVTTDRSWYRSADSVLVNIRNNAQETVKIGRRSACEDNISEFSTNESGFLVELVEFPILCPDCKIRAVFDLPPNESRVVVWKKITLINPTTCAEEELSQPEYPIREYSIIVYYHNTKGNEWVAVSSPSLGIK